MAMPVPPEPQLGMSRPTSPTRVPVGMPVPLTDMGPGDRYKGEDGGLYGGGRNDPPRSHLEAALGVSACIRPLGLDGSPSPKGLIGFLSIGFSNTSREFEQFIRLAVDDPKMARAVRMVNGAQAHCGTAEWAGGAATRDSSEEAPWRPLAGRLELRRVAPSQVQVVWLKLGPARPADLGDFPAHAIRTKHDLATLLTALRQGFPNLRIVYLSCRTYAGYAVTPLSPEPYAYEVAFAIRWLILDQIRGDPALNCHAASGPVKAPLLLWGPYLWARGTEGRKAGDLAWEPQDFAVDGTHPSAIGATKAARLLLRFVKTDPTATPWFLK